MTIHYILIPLITILFCLALYRKVFRWYHYLIAMMLAAVIDSILDFILC